jgi:tetratricopeptide (TPR) repeat protein
MRALLVALWASLASAQPVVAVAPPSADTPALAEAGLLMQAQVSTYLQGNGYHELHAKQILRALELHGLDLRALADAKVAERARSLLGAPLFVYAQMTAKSIVVRGLGDAGAIAAEETPLPPSLAAMVDAGALAMARFVARAAKREPPKKLGATTASEAALAAYGSCYAVLIRQPISVDSPAVLSAPELIRAVKACRASLAADPNYDAARAALGLALAIAGEDGEAVKALVAVHADREYLPLYWLGRYWLVTRYQSPENGVMALQQALKQHPGLLLVRGYLADHLMVTGRSADALEVWRAYSAELPKNAYLRGRISAALARLGRNDEAIAAAKEALAIDRTDRDAVLELGSRQLDAGKRDEAIATLQAAADGNSRAELLLRLGWAYFENGDLVRAEQLLHRAEEKATLPSEWRTRARARADLARIADARHDPAAVEANMRRALDEGAGPYLRGQRDRRLQELVTAVEKSPRMLAFKPRIVPPTEVSPFHLDPAGEVDLHGHPKSPPSQFDLLRF